MRMPIFSRKKHGIVISYVNRRFFTKGKLKIPTGRSSLFSGGRSIHLDGLEKLFQKRLGIRF